MPGLITVTQPAHKVLIAAGLRGAPGAIGPIGPDGHSASNYQAGTILGGHRVVYASGAIVRYADCLNLDTVEQVVGITLQAAAVDEPIAVQRYGVIVELTWSWTPGPVYLGNTGLLTQVLPASGAVLQVGVALDSTTLDVRLGTPFFLD